MSSARFLWTKCVCAMRGLARPSSHGPVFSAMITVASLTLLVKVVSAAKEIEVARSLGIGDSLDAFYIAFLVPGTIITIVAGTLNTALIPVYVRVREHQGPGPACRLYSSMMVLSLALLVGIAGLLAVCFPELLTFIGGSFGPAKIACTRSLFYLLLPVIALTGISTTWGAVLNASHRFALIAVTPIATPAVVIASMFLFGRAHGVFALAGATLTGAAAEAAILGVGLRRLGMPLGLRWFGMSRELKQVLMQYAPLAAGALVFSGTSFADQTLAARLGSGAVASLAYGNKIVSLIVGVGATGVGASVLPHFSQLVAVRDLQGLRAALRLSTGVILAAGIVAACVLALASAPIVRLVFQHGAFTAADTRVVSRVQVCFALGIPVSVIGTLYLKLISSLSMNNRVLVIAGINVILNFLLDLLFMRFLGVAGIALSTSFVALSTCIMLSFMLKRPLYEQQGDSQRIETQRGLRDAVAEAAPSDAAA